MKLYQTSGGVVLEAENGFHPLIDQWDALINREDLVPYLRFVVDHARGGARMDVEVLAPIGAQEVWAAGVTYLRSRAARVDESQASGGGSFYDRVYEAERPELFFKASPWRVRGPDAAVRIRRDATWSVPEPELALYINSMGVIVGYTIGNDMSSRDIEGENPLYLSQAKIYDGSCALGPCVLVREEPIASTTNISITIRRDDVAVFEGSTSLDRMRRTHEELAGYLYRETSFPNGCVLLTGTGVVPPDDFTLQSGDEIVIRVAPIGTLVNFVA